MFYNCVILINLIKKKNFHILKASVALAPLAETIIN